MKILFNKIPQNGMEFKTSYKDIKFYGKLKKESRNLVQCNGKLEGTLDCSCDRCGDDISLHVDEKIKVIACDGFYKSGEELLNIIEFFEENVDLDTILLSEVETLKSDYHYCSACK